MRFEFSDKEKRARKRSESSKKDRIKKASESLVSKTLKENKVAVPPQPNTVCYRVG